jgi:pimeloyl-ACP methyl ester carboxylesterase
VRVPPAGGKDAPLFVTVHGTSRNAREHVELFEPLVDAQGVVLLAPLFEAGPFEDYQRLGRTRLGGGRADRALEAAIAEVGRRSGSRTERVYLFGYSGGAQFAHRFVLAHPERVAAAAISSAGWYTFPAPGLPYPLGIGSATGLPGVRFDPDAFLRVPLLVTVGEDDTLRDDSLRRDGAIDREQGRTRAERARRWVAAMRSAARSRGISAEIELRELPGTGHSFEQNMEEAGLGEIVFEHLFAPRAGAQRDPVPGHPVGLTPRRSAPPSRLVQRP